MVRKKNNLYSSKNVIIISVLGILLLWLLYSIANFLHESEKITQQIEKIKNSNLQLAQKIKEKEQYLKYLETPQRIEKEAKIQMGKALPGEKVIVFVEEELEILPTQSKKKQERRRKKEIPNWQKWKEIFWDN